MRRAVHRCGWCLMRALVIGGSGFIGLHLVDALVTAGFEVRVTTRKSTPTMFLRKRPVELVPASLEDANALRTAMVGCDVVMLAGAYYPRYSLDQEAALEQGLAGIRNVVSAAHAAGIQRIIYTSTIATLAPARGALADEQDVCAEMPRDSVYCAVKWAMERELESGCAGRIELSTLLVGGCVGPGDLRVGTTGVLVGAIRGVLPFYVGGIVNLVDVRDVARVHVAAIDGPAGRYCVAPHNVRLGELLRQIVQRYGGRVPERVTAADGAARALLSEREAAPNRARVALPRELVDIVARGQAVSSARAQEQLGIAFAPLWPALDATHDYFVRYGYLPRTQHKEGQSI
jgi:dihydroflavonol-4-reductase